MVQKKQVIIGLLGTVVDAGSGVNRWQRWRPTVAMGRHEGLCVDRVELIAQKKFSRLADQISEDIRTISSATEVRIRWVEFNDPWDFQEVYSAFLDFAKHY